MTATSNASSAIQKLIVATPRRGTEIGRRARLALYQVQGGSQLGVLGEAVGGLIDGVLVGGFGERNRTVGCDARLLYGMPVRGEPVGNREVQVAISQRKVFLH